jgi:protein ImuB
VSHRADTLVTIAREFSPRYERRSERLMTIDVSGLERLLGSPRTIGGELQRDALARGALVHVAIAGTCTAALLLALERPGLTIVDRDAEAEAVAPLPIRLLEALDDVRLQQAATSLKTPDPKDCARGAVSVFKRWGLQALGDLAALPAADLSARLGRRGLLWQAIARGEDVRPLVPDAIEERFEGSLDLEWPIDSLEPLSFVLTRLLEPLSLRLERRDRAAARLRLELRLVTRASAGLEGEAVDSQDVHARQLQLPSPIRDVRTLRTLLVLDLESHPPPAAIDRVAVTIEPTPGRVVQHSLFRRARPKPEQLSTLLARLGALMGQDRIGMPATVESFRPGAFDVVPFSTDHTGRDWTGRDDAEHIWSALRRFRRPIPARVAIAEGRPVRVTTDRQGFAGAAVLSSAGPWRTSGEWWALHFWSRDEWDVALGDGAAYRIFRDRDTDRWFIDGILD